ncbi:MAG: hypothetical protein O7G83_16705 [Proteobacteria bacterium]|nr:hypothetical protein [Pseudomonadota bacterium]
MFAHLLESETLQQKFARQSWPFAGVSYSKKSPFSIFARLIAAFRPGAIVRRRTRIIGRFLSARS